MRDSCSGIGSPSCPKSPSELLPQDARHVGRFPWEMCSRQLNPLEMMRVSGRRVAERRATAQVPRFRVEISYLSVTLESEGAGHAQHPGRRAHRNRAHPGQDSFLGIHFHDGLMVAVSVNQCFSGEARKLKIFRVAFEELAQQECLLRKRTGTDVIRKEIDQFVAKAARNSAQVLRPEYRLRFPATGCRGS